MVTASAPGKLMIVGEHAVLYGQPCIVTAVNARLRVTVRHSEERQSRIDVPPYVNTRFVDAALARARERWRIHTPVDIQTASDFPPTYGFGSSAAVVVATLKALAVLWEKHVDNTELFQMARDVVIKVQGVGSGFDVAAAIWGGTIYFADNGSVIEPLNGLSLSMIIGYTGEKADTTQLVSEVASKRAQYPERVDRIMQAIGQYVDQGKKSLVEGEWDRVGKIMNFVQEYLRDLGVSSGALENLIKAARDAGALGAKLSGAGGGDCMIALVTKESRESVAAAIRSVGGQVLNVDMGAQGVRLEPAGEAGIESTDDEKELLVVVDTKDNILGYKTRYECHHDKALIHRGVTVLIFNNEGDVLLQKRSMTKDTHPGMWSTSVGGHVAKGETYEEAAVREMSEELGITLPVSLHSTFLFAYPYEAEMEALFIAQGEGPFELNREEIADAVFVSKRELPRKLLSKEIILTELAHAVLVRVGFLS